MRSNRLNSILGRMAGSETAEKKCDPALEAELLSRYRQLYPRNRRWLMLLNPWHRFARIAVVGLTLCLVVVAACTTETITDVEVGKRVQMNVGAETDAQPEDGQAIFIFKYISPDDVPREAKKLSDVLIVQPGVSDASVSISQKSDGEATVDMLVWGEHLDTDKLVNTLQEANPFLANASVTVDDLNASVKETYASKIGRELFHVEVGGSDPEELRLQVLEQLAAQGFTGHATVDVETEGDQQIIHIEMEDE
jgi:hypothetical protein